MDHTTTDTDALMAEVDALLADSAATGSTAVRIADLALQAQLASRELDVQARYQRRIARAIGA